MPGSNSSARISIAMPPPMKNISSANIRYSVPMSLWLVVVIQRSAQGMNPLLAWWPPWVWVSSATVLISFVPCVLALSPRRLLLLVEPGGVLGLAHHLDHDRHEAVILPAELGTLAAISPLGVGLDPRAAHEARH